MFCSTCGKHLSEGTHYCPYCGHTLLKAESGECPIEATPVQAVSPANPRISVAAIVWCVLCLVANLALAIVSVVALSSQRGGSFVGVAAIVVTFVAVFGFTMLLFTNREGFYVICIAALAGIILNLIAGKILNVVFGILNPTVTWLFIKSSWARMRQPFEKPRSRKTALILACISFTSWFGFDRIYLGYGWLGFLKAITCGGLLAWYVIDIVRLAKGTIQDGFHMPLIWRGGSSDRTQSAQGKEKALCIWGIVLIAMGLIAGISSAAAISSGNSGGTAGSIVMGPIIFGGVGLFLLLKGRKRRAQE